MRIGLTAKLLLMLGVTSLVSVAAMALAARWSFQHGFLDYLGQQELARIAPLREVLSPIYARDGSWEYFERNPAAWPRFVDDTLQPDQARPPGPPPGAPEMPPGESLLDFHQGAGQEPGPLLQPPGSRPLRHPPGSEPLRHPPGSRPLRHPPGPGQPPLPPPSELLGLRVHLLDAQGHQVAGVPSIAQEAFRLPIELDGVAIGWLLLSPRPGQCPADSVLSWAFWLGPLIQFCANLHRPALFSLLE